MASTTYAPSTISTNGTVQSSIGEPERSLFAIAVERNHLGAFVATKVIDQPIVRNGVDPGRELGRRCIGCAHANRIHPHILEQLVGDAAVAAMSQQVSVDAALVPRVER